MVNIIVARSKNNIIGNKGMIPWHIPEDLQYFKRLTTNHVVIMGKNTYESIKKPLPNRINIIVSTSMSNRNKNDLIVETSLPNAINYAKENYPEKEIFLIGGYGIYKEGIQYANKLYITEIDKEVEGDTSFVEFDESNYIKEIPRELVTADNTSVEFAVYTKRYKIELFVTDKTGKYVDKHYTLYQSMES